MSVPKKKRPGAADKDAIGTMVDQISDLIKDHWSEFKSVLEKSETQKAGWTFAVSVDQSEGKMGIRTVSTFSEVHKDKRTNELDDPAQLKIPGTERTDTKMRVANDDSGDE